MLLSALVVEEVVKRLAYVEGWNRHLPWAVQHLLLVCASNLPLNLVDCLFRGIFRSLDTSDLSLGLVITLQHVFRIDPEVIYFG